MFGFPFKVQNTFTATSHTSEEEEPRDNSDELRGATWSMSKVIQWMKWTMGVKNWLYMVFVSVLHLL